MCGDPGSQSHRRIIQAVPERLRLRALDLHVAGLFLLEHVEAVEDLAIGRGQLRRVGRLGRAAINMFRWMPTTRSGTRGRARSRWPRPIAALGPEARIAEVLHQAGEQRRHAHHVHTRLRRPLGKPVPRQRRHEQVEGVLRVPAVGRRVGQRPDDVDELDDRARPAVHEEQRQRRGPRPRSWMKWSHPAPSAAAQSAVDHRLLRAPVEALDPAHRRRRWAAVGARTSSRSPPPVGQRVRRRRSRRSSRTASGTSIRNGAGVTNGPILASAVGVTVDTRNCVRAATRRRERGLPTAGASWRAAATSSSNDRDTALTSASRSGISLAIRVEAPAQSIE